MTGESDSTDVANTILAKTPAAQQLTAAKTNDGTLTVVEEELLAHYRKLSPTDRRKVRLYAANLAVATPAAQRKR